MPPPPRRSVLLAVVDPERTTRFLQESVHRHAGAGAWLRCTELDALERLPAHVRSVVVLADGTTPHAARAARLCWMAHEQHVPAVLVRFGRHPAHHPWPSHPVAAVVDVDVARAAMVEELLQRCFIAERTLELPLSARDLADVVLVTGDPRPHPFAAAIDHAGLAYEVVKPRYALRSSGSRCALWFRHRDSAPDSTRVHPLEERALPHDPRRYHESIEPLDDIESRAGAIAALHATHGNWASTRRLVMECMEAAPAPRARVLATLARLLDEPRARTWNGVCALAWEHATGSVGQTPHQFPPWVDPPRRAGHDGDGRPWKREALDRDMDRTDELRAYADVAGRFMMGGECRDADTPVAANAGGAEAIMDPGHENLVDGLLDDHASLLRGFMEPEDHERLTAPGRPTGKKSPH